jgi:hypothetical protein
MTGPTDIRGFELGIGHQVRRYRTQRHSTWRSGPGSLATSLEPLEVLKSVTDGSADCEIRVTTFSRRQFVPNQNIW